MTRYKTEQEMHAEVFANEVVVGAFRGSEDNFFLKCQSGKVIELSVYGDCCSYSSFEQFHISLPFFMPTNGMYEESSRDATETDQDCDSLYEVEFPGGFWLQHRNSSNGYYGGNLSVDVRHTVPQGAEPVEDWEVKRDSKGWRLGE